MGEMNERNRGKSFEINDLIIILIMWEDWGMCYSVGKILVWLEGI